VSVKEYLLPHSLDEAVTLLAQHGDSLLVMAGGTIAMPLINDGISRPDRVMGLRHTGLDYVRHSNSTLSIGAMTTLAEISGDEAIPLLQAATHNTGGWAIRNMGTVGGNLFAPPPAGDVAVALLALDAQAKLVGQSADRLVPLADFYRGFMSTALQPDELLAEIQVPVPKGKTVYLKAGRKHANTPAIVTVAVHLIMDGEQVKEARLALNAVGPHPLRATKAEAILVKGGTLDEATITAAAAAATEECEPFTDAIASEWYRRKVVGTYVKRALAQIAGKEA
jgi:CO/xanthine dehydrogenase FAD-binding subunit